MPMGDTRNQDWAYVEAPREVLSTIDWKPRVNGYSGYSPPGYEHEIDVFNGLANPAPADAMPQLDQLGVRYIVIRTASADPQLAIAGVTYDDPGTAARIVAALPASRVESVTSAGAAVLIRLRPPP